MDASNKEIDMHKAGTVDTIGEGTLGAETVEVTENDTRGDDTTSNLLSQYY